MRKCHFTYYGIKYLYELPSCEARGQQLTVEHILTDCHRYEQD